MLDNSQKKDLNLKTLELFQICAEKGSLIAVSNDTGLSVSTVSHHLRGLETVSYTHLTLPTKRIV